MSLMLWMFFHNLIISGLTSN